MATITKVSMTEFVFDVPNNGLDPATAGVRNLAQGTPVRDDPELSISYDWDFINYHKTQHFSFE